MHPGADHFLPRLEPRAHHHLVAIDRPQLHRLAVDRHAGFIQHPNRCALPLLAQSAGGQFDSRYHRTGQAGGTHIQSGPQRQCPAHTRRQRQLQVQQQLELLEQQQLEKQQQMEQQKELFKEKMESLEQLRWMYHGYPIKVVQTTIETPNIDTPEDVENVLLFL